MLIGEGNIIVVMPFDPCIAFRWCNQSIYTCISINTCIYNLFTIHMNPFFIFIYLFIFRSGSHGQSVTGMPVDNDTNSYWSVKAGLGQRQCVHGEAIGCDSIIRLMHVNTRKHLHSGSWPSALSGRQELSCAGDDDAGSTPADNWKVICKSGQQWKRNGAIALLHVSTGAFLYAQNGQGFNQQNCGQCPILGQLEITCSPHTHSNDRLAEFSADLGIFFPKRAREDLWWII